VPADRRSYVFNFQGWNWPIFDKFPVENKSTGEMLLLDRAIKGDDEPFGQCRLRRCLTEEIANGLMFYAKLFTVDRGYAEFEIEGNTTKVLIESEHL
jgi:hypothetical protein